MPTTGRKARVVPPSQQKIWVLPESLDEKPLVADLQKIFQVRLEKAPVRVRKWFDTDDWRLYQRNLLLYQEQRKWYLVHRDTGDVIATFSGEKSEKFRYPWDFPVSRIRTLLEPILSIRSVLPLLTQESSTVPIRILNKDNKTISLIYLDDHTTLDTTPE